MNITISKNALKKRFDYDAYFERRKLLYRMLGGICSECGAEPKQIEKRRTRNGKKKMMSNLQIHHVFYPFGEFQNGHSWGACSEDDFWNIHFPEIMESCILLCVKCHRKVTRYNFRNCIRKLNS